MNNKKYERGTLNYYIEYICKAITETLNNNWIDIEKYLDENEGSYLELVTDHFNDYLETDNFYIAKFLLSELYNLDLIYEEMNENGYDKTIDLMHHVLYTEFTDKISSWDLLDILLDYDCKINDEQYKIMSEYENK